MVLPRRSWWDFAWIWSLGLSIFRSKSLGEIYVKTKEPSTYLDMVHPSKHGLVPQRHPVGKFSTRLLGFKGPNNADVCQMNLGHLGFGISSIPSRNETSHNAMLQKPHFDISEERSTVNRMAHGKVPIVVFQDENKFDKQK